MVPELLRRVDKMKDNNSYQVIEEDEISYVITASLVCHIFT